MTIRIWATRGRPWDFRFLLNQGYSDPLRTYESAFIGLQDEVEGDLRVGDDVALRFPDPLNRKDTAGRVIPDFVVTRALADDINSVENGRVAIWPLVAELYAQSGVGNTLRQERSSLLLTAALH